MKDKIEIAEIYVGCLCLGVAGLSAIAYIGYYYYF